MRIVWFPILLFSGLGLLAAAQRLEYGSMLTPTFKSLTFEGAEIFRNKDNTEDIRLSRTGLNPASRDLLLFSFENPIPAHLRDDSGHYRVRESSYSRTADARAGQAAGLFSLRENKIAIESPAELWPGKGPLGEFTIEMWIKPLHFMNKNSLFKRDFPDAAYRNGQNRGIELYIKNGFLFADFPAIFRDRNGPIEVSLQSLNRIPQGSWTHLAVSVSTSQKFVALYINGAENQVVQLPADYTAPVSLRDRAPIILAESYMGVIDEFRLSNRAIAADFLKTSNFQSLRIQNDRPVQKPGKVTSDVERLRNNDVATRSQLSYKVDLPEGTVLEFYFRSSLSPFSRDVPESILPWKSVKDQANRLSPFRYYQWRALLKADARGANTPVLKSIELEYEPARSPDPVQGVRIAAGFSTDLQTCIEWDVLPENGNPIEYRIYYGYHPDEMAGMIRYHFVRGLLEPIQKPASAQPLSAFDRAYLARNPEESARYLARRLRVVVTNDLIAANMARDRRRTMPLLENGRVVYFSVSAVQSSPVELESAPSRIVQTTLAARPDLE